MNNPYEFDIISTTTKRKHTEYNNNSKKTKLNPVVSKKRTIKPATINESISFKQLKYNNITS